MERRAEKLKLLEPVDYNAPQGFFDLAARGEAAPAPVMELEDGSVRMGLSTHQQCSAHVLSSGLALCRHVS